MVRRWSARGPVVTWFDGNHDDRFALLRRIVGALTSSLGNTLSRWRHGYEPRWDYQVTGHIGASKPRRGHLG